MTKFKTGIVVGSILIVSAAILHLIQPGSTPPILNENREPLLRSIASLEKIELRDDEHNYTFVLVRKIVGVWLKMPTILVIFFLIR